MNDFQRREGRKLWAIWIGLGILAVACLWKMQQNDADCRNGDREACGRIMNADAMPTEYRSHAIRVLSEPKEGK